MGGDQDNTKVAKPGTVSGAHRFARWTLFALLAVLAWSPAIFTGLAIDRYAVDIPVWDDFERVPLIDRYESGELTPSFLVSPHIEHRILLPRLIILANHVWGGGDLRNEVWVIFGSILVSSLCLAWLIFRTVGRTPTGWVLVLLVNATLFTLIQYENLCWAIQTGMLLPQMFLCLTLVVLYSKLPPTAKLGFALAGSLAASFCFTHGLIVWLVVLGYLLVGPWTGSLAKRFTWVGVWTLLLAGFFSFYFHDLTSTSSPYHSYFQEPGEAPPGLKGLLAGEGDPAGISEYMRKALGSQFSRFTLVPPRYVAEKVGLFQAGLFLFLASVGILGLVVALRRGRMRPEAWRNLLPWLAIGGFVLVTVFVMALGRAHISVNRAMAPRYVSITLYLTVAILPLVPLVFRIVAAYRPRAAILEGGRLCGFVAAGGFLCLQVWNQAYGERCLAIWSAARWQSLMVLAFPDFSPPRFEDRLDFDGREARKHVERMKAHGRFDELPDPIGPNDFARFRISSKSLGARRAGVTELRRQVRGWEVSGFADTRSFLGRVPDGIVFTVDEGEARRIVGYGEAVATPAYYVNEWDFEFELISPQSLEVQTRWEGRILDRNLPGDRELPLAIQAWAVDFRNRRVHRFEEVTTIGNDLVPPDFSETPAPERPSIGQADPVETELRVAEAETTESR